MRAVLVVALFSVMLAACGGDDEAAIESRAATMAASMVAQVETPTVDATPNVDERAATISAKLTAIAQSPTAEPTPRPTSTPRPTPTPEPTPTPTPSDLTKYLPIETDVFGPFTIMDEREVDASSFVYSEGLLQGRIRTLAKPDPPIEIAASCAEYSSHQQAISALESQHQAMMEASELFSLSDDNGDDIDTENAYLAVGTTQLENGSRPVAIAWFQSDRVMCFDITLGVPDGDAPPRGAAIDAANNVLERLAQATLPTPTPIPGGPDIFSIGQTIRFEDGFNISIKTLEDPVVVGGEAISPRASIVLMAIEVEACAGPTTAGASINPLDFEVSLDDNTRADRSYGLMREPLLDSARLFRGECLRGWVTFERHWSPRPVYIIIDLLGYSTVRVKAR